MPTITPDMLKARREDKAALLDLQSVLDNAAGGLPSLVDSKGKHAELPPSAVALLRDGIAMFRRGVGVRLVPVHRELSTQEAADVLNVSRQYLVRLLDDGKIPFSRTGNRRRIAMEDVMNFKQARDDARLKGLAELAQMDEDAGLYDLEAEEAKP
jgi:excisionase family DNA binding protein